MDELRLAVRGETYAAPLEGTSRKHDGSGDNEGPAVFIEVNGEDIRQLLGRPHVAALPLAEVAPPSMHWLGRPLYGGRGRTALFTCSCGVFSCGGISCEIRVGQETVTWRDFVEQPSEKSSAPVSFEFDRGQYEGELDKLTYGRQGGSDPPP